jgi:hypothetical protein
MKVLFQKLAPAEPNQQDMHSADARHESQIMTSFSMNRDLRAFDLTAKAEGNKVVLGGTVQNDI